MKREISRNTKIVFVFVLLGILAIAFSIQLFFLNSSNGKIVAMLSYFINYTICIASFFILAKLSKKDTSNLGSVFLIFTMLKFGTYFLGFRFYFLQDNVVSREEYSLFFVPYLISIIVEVSFLIKHLNSLEMDSSKFVVIKDDEEELSIEGDKMTEEGDDLK